MVATVDMKVKGKKVNNVGRDQGRRMGAIRKKVNERTPICSVEGL